LPATAESPKVAVAALLHLARWWRQHDAGCSGETGDGGVCSAAGVVGEGDGVDRRSDGGVGDAAIMGGAAAGTQTPVGRGARSHRAANAKGESR